MASSNLVISSSKSGWAWLPKDLLDVILSNLLTLSDYIRFNAVCKPWRCTALDHHNLPNHRSNPLHQLPLLLVSPPTKTVSQHHHPPNRTRSFYSITSRKLSDFKFLMPNINGNKNKRCCGSSHGWLIITDHDTLIITLFNPFIYAQQDGNKGGGSGGLIHLPAFRGEKSENYVARAILSADPAVAPHDYAVIIIYGSLHLAFIKSGHKHWTLIEYNWLGYVDFIYCKNLLYIVNDYGTLKSCDISSNTRSSPELKVIACPPFRLLNVSLVKNYAVETLSSGDILQVQRIFNRSFYAYNDDDDDPEPRVTVGFRVFKLVAAEWVEMDNLGDGALFLGNNCSMHVWASEFSGCQPNSIYFTDDILGSNPQDGVCHRSFVSDTGVFSLGDGKIQRFHELDDCYLDRSPGIWVVPTFKENIS